jgi:peptidoglycan hydrolase-like protein with peptidoglycan-binding domain
VFTPTLGAHAQVSSSKDLQALIDDLLMRVDLLQSQLQLIQEDSKMYVVDENNVYGQLKLYTQYPPKKITRTLQIGHTGVDVEEIQAYLARDILLYPEQLVTGYYGALTQKAIQKFQARYGIVNSGTPATTGYGQVGPKTREKINERIARHRLNVEIEARKNDVQNVTPVVSEADTISKTQEGNMLEKNDTEPTTPPPSIVIQNSSSTRGTYKNLVDIIFDTRPDMFLESLFYQSVDYEFTKINENEVMNSFWLFSRALDKYPAHILDDHLKEIYVLGNLRRSGLDMGGAAAPDIKRLFIVNKGNLDYFVEQIYHHDFSHMLYSAHVNKSLESKWIQLNSDGFEYGSGGLDAHKKGVASTAFDEKYIKAGFLSEYSVSAWPEDFSVTAQYMFKSQPNFWNIVDSNERIHQKVLLVVEFYNSLDPVFTEQYFREISTR